MNMTNYEDIAKFILGFCSIGVSSELPEDEHIRFLTDALKKAPEELLYYLSDAANNHE